MNARLACTIIMKRISVALPISPTAISFVKRKSAPTNFANFPTTNSNNCTTPIAIKPNSVNFIPRISKNATTKVFVPSLIPRMKSSKTSSWSTYCKKLTIFIFANTRQCGAHLLKSIFMFYEAMNATSVFTRITFKTFGEIPKSTLTMQSSVNIGIFLIKLSRLKRLDVRWEWSAKSVMGGWN